MHEPGAADWLCSDGIFIPSELVKRKTYNHKTVPTAWKCRRYIQTAAIHGDEEKNALTVAGRPHTFRSPSDELHRSSIPRQYVVVSEQAQGFDQGLGHEDAVERVGMVGFKRPRWRRQCRRAR